MDTAEISYRVTGVLFEVLVLKYPFARQCVDAYETGRPPIRHFTLDALCAMFGVVPYGRHTAGDDAFITAQVFLRLLRLASRSGRDTLGRLSEPFLEPA